MLQAKSSRRKNSGDLIACISINTWLTCVAVISGCSDGRSCSEGSFADGNWAVMVLYIKTHAALSKTFSMYSSDEHRYMEGGEC